MTTTFHLLALPLELRLKVYHHVLRDQNRPKGIISRLLRTNRQVHRELADLLQKTFRFVHFIVKGSTAVANLMFISPPVVWNNTRHERAAREFTKYHLEITISPESEIDAYGLTQHACLINEEYTEMLDSLGSTAGFMGMGRLRRMRYGVRFLPTLPQNLVLQAQIEKELGDEIGKHWRNFHHVEFTGAGDREWARALQEKVTR